MFRCVGTNKKRANAMWTGCEEQTIRLDAILHNGEHCQNSRNISGIQREMTSTIQTIDISTADPANWRAFQSIYYIVYLYLRVLSNASCYSILPWLSSSSSNGKHIRTIAVAAQIVATVCSIEQHFGFDITDIWNDANFSTAGREQHCCPQH